MKKLFVVTGLLFLCGYAIGQAKDGTADLQLTTASQPAASIYLPYSPKVVEKALANYISKVSEREQRNANGYLLSSNTLIVKNNKSGSDMRFIIGLKDPKNVNESVVYLKLNSTSNYADSAEAETQFDMQDAKDYLDNLAIAIKPYAGKLQLELQQKNLADARNKNTSLIQQGDKLDQKGKNIQIKIGENENYKRDKGLARRKAKNDRLIIENLAAQLNLSNDIAKQMAALGLLKIN
jgi:hypothetical protein